MSYVFRLYNKNANKNVVDWKLSPTNPYGTNMLSNIPDPDGATASKEITSIPSPFARMELVCSAFEKVVDKNDSNNSNKASGKFDLKGDTIFHRMVSEAFDVGELFFHYNTWQQDLKLLEWDRKKEIANIKDANYKDVLDTYISSDFPKLDCLYILTTATGTVVGATSPSSIFFGSANDLSQDATLKKMRFGAHTLFDRAKDGSQPLYLRDFAYVKAWFQFRNQYNKQNNNQFADDFKAINDYLDATYTFLSTAQQTNITNLPNNGNALVTTNFNVTILGTPILALPAQTSVTTSDFFIQSSNHSQKTLFLPNENTSKYKHWQYTSSSVLLDENKGPFRDTESDPNKRKLPGVGLQFPYLTVGDFLTDSILELPKKDDDDFYTLEKDNRHFLLPLTDLFFEFFPVDKFMTDSSNLISCEILGNGVNITLNIPVTKGTVTCSRKYVVKKANSPLVEETGEIIKRELFDVALFPMSKPAGIKSPYYSLSVCSSNERQSVNNVVYDVKMMNSQKVSQCRNYRKDDAEKMQSWVCEEDFDYIRIGFSLNSKPIDSVIIPKWRSVQNAASNTFHFAVDLGTSNTHIAYVMGDKGEPVDFDISDKDCQIGILSGASKPLIEEQLMPRIIGDGKNKFPHKTMLSIANGVSYNNNGEIIYPFCDSNIPFSSFMSWKDFNNCITDIKWANNDTEKKILKNYIENIVLLLRAKVLLNGGILGATTLTWFYPTSMNTSQQRSLEGIWKELFVKYFGPQNVGTQLQSMTESEAPCQYIINNVKVHSTLLCVDIGGGTSDVTYYDGTAKDIKFVSSFRFASNAILGRGYAPSLPNEMVEHFKSKICDDLDKNEDPISKPIKSAIEKSASDSSNLAQMLFSVEDILDSEDSKLNASDFSFLKMLKEGEDGIPYKIVFLFFYVAILYHVAHIVKEKKLDKPRQLAFTGNGSKLLDIVFLGKKEKQLLSDMIFKRVLGEDSGCMDIYSDEHPKELTCYGGLASANNMNVDISKKKLILGIDNKIIEDGETYGEINNNYCNKVVTETEEFVKFFEELDKDFSFYNNLGTEKNAVALIKECMDRGDLMTFVLNGKESEGADQGDPISETLFFYPIIGIISKLIEKISKQSNNS